MIIASQFSCWFALIWTIRKCLLIFQPWVLSIVNSTLFLRHCRPQGAPSSRRFYVIADGCTPPRFFVNEIREKVDRCIADVKKVNRRGGTIAETVVANKSSSQRNEQDVFTFHPISLSFRFSASCPDVISGRHWLVHRYREYVDGSGLPPGRLLNFDTARRTMRVRSFTPRLSARLKFLRQELQSRSYEMQQPMSLRPNILL